MKRSGLKFLVIGAGAVGGITAALLRKNDINVEIVCKHADYASLISETGIKLKSSSLQSIERGKPTEIDCLNGYIVMNGNKFGVPVPVNTIIVNMIHQIELRERNITILNFEDPFFDRFN